MEQQIANEQFRPIKIVVAYPWEKDIEGAVKNPRSDKRWKFFKDKAASEAEAVKKIAGKRPTGKPPEIRIERLRGRHGHLLLPNLRERIEAADILLMDIGSASNKERFNTNVLIEVGMALGCGHLFRGGLFIFKPRDQEPPSDLRGFLFSDYDENESGVISLADDAGFRAALRSSLVDLAISMGMIGAPQKPLVETDDLDDKRNS